MDAPVIVGVTPPRQGAAPNVTQQIQDTVAQARDTEGERRAALDAVANAARHAERIAAELIEARETARQLNERPAWKWILLWWLGRK